MVKYDYETQHYEVTFKTATTVRGRKHFDTAEEAISYAESIKHKDPLIYERRKMIIDIDKS